MAVVKKPVLSGFRTTLLIIPVLTMLIANALAHMPILPEAMAKELAVALATDASVFIEAGIGTLVLYFNLRRGKPALPRLKKTR